MVLLAMGFVGPEREIIDEMSVKLDPRGNMETPRNHYTTSVPKVYAAGGKIYCLSHSIEDMIWKVVDCNLSFGQLKAGKLSAQQ